MITQRPAVLGGSMLLLLSAASGQLNHLIVGASEEVVELEPIPIPEHLPEVKLDVSRAERFPSAEERVKLYMSNWYAPPCDDASLTRFEVQAAEYNNNEWPVYTIHESSADVGLNASSYIMETAIEPDKAFVLDRGTVLDCSVREGQPKYKDRIQFRSNMYMYCLDVAHSVLPAMDHVSWEQQEHDSSTSPVVPLIFQFGDLKHSHVYKFLSIPHLKKFRIAGTPQDLQAVTQVDCSSSPRPVLGDLPILQPIVWKLATRRHYGLLDQVAVKDMPWEDKRDMAVFRGQLTGSRDGYNKHLSDEENCLNLRRCRLVYKHASSKLVNARLTNTRGRLPDVLNGVELTTGSVTVRHLLRYKGVVMLEGNDVASGLKWALLSNSIVLMPIPKHTSWAMEEILQPWVHYVPLNEDATDVEEKMQWVVDHDTEAQRISYAATLWMQDLVYHPDAAEDDRLIQEEIIRRYRRHFAPVVATTEK